MDANTHRNMDFLCVIRIIIEIKKFAFVCSTAFTKTGHELSWLSAIRQFKPVVNLF